MGDFLRDFKLTGLRARLLAIVLLAVVPLTALLIGYASIESTAAEDLARAEVQRSLQADAVSLQDLVAQSRATLVTFGITYAIQARDWALAQGNADRLLVEHPEYASIVVADSSGRVRASTPRSATPADISQDTSFRRAVETRQLVVSGYSRDSVTAKPTINVSLPVYDAKDRLIAVESIAFDPSQFATRLTASPGTVAVLIDSAGTLVARAPRLAGAVGKRFPEAALVRTILATRSGTAALTGLDGVARQYFFAPVITGVAPGPLHLAVGFSPEELLAPQRRTLAVTLLGFGVVALVVLVISGVVGTYSIYRPARQLEQAVEKVSAGDLAARVDMGSRSDEFGALGGDFNKMAEAIQLQVAQIEAARKELDALNADLERRVRTRTAELETSNKELEAFSYSVSHDLRSPLRAIDGFSQALVEDYGDVLDGEAKVDLQRIRDNTKRMGELIDSLLILSRLSRQDMHVETIDMTALATEALADVRREWPDRDVAVIIEPCMTGEGDPALVRIALDNLMSNAFKFTSKHDTAKIEVGAMDEDGETVFFVRDDGAGFDMAYAGKLFGAFQRVHGQKEFPGIGIGLATAARIVHRHGGRIWAQGEPEKGAAFFFTL